MALAPGIESASYAVTANVDVNNILTMNVVMEALLEDPLPAGLKNAV